MSDTLSHATQGGLMLVAPFIAWVRSKARLGILMFIGGFFGALPDLIGAYGNFILHDHWSLYGSAHHGAIKDALQYIPMYWLHLFVDSYTHGDGHRWWFSHERLWAEVLLWCVNLMAITVFVMIWKRTAHRR